ncbi:MAG: hypothetical protein ACLQF0_13610 [Dissulfurispiraceae bacterium]
MRVRNLVFLIPVLTLLLLTACGGGSSSSNSSFNNANLNGTFFTASLDQSGGIVGEFGDSTYDGKGNGTYTGNYSSSSGAHQAESDSGTYSVSANGSFTLTGTSGGVTNCGLSADTNTAVCASVSNKTYQSINVLVKAASSGLSNANLSGTYYLASLDESAGFTAEFGSMTFDGKGNGTFTGTMGSSTGTGANQTDNDTGTYAVNPNGAFTLTGTSGSVMNCGLSADTNTAVCSTVSATTYQNVAVMVKAGSGGYSNASLKGKYYMVEGDTNGGFNSQTGNLTFDGQGNFTSVGTLNNATAANQSSTSLGTYSVNANGSFTMTPSGGSAMQCGISADTNTVVCATVSNTADQNILVLVKAP